MAILRDLRVSKLSSSCNTAVTIAHYAADAPGPYRRSRPRAMTGEVAARPERLPAALRQTLLMRVQVRTQRVRHDAAHARGPHAHHHERSLSLVGGELPSTAYSRARRLHTCASHQATKLLCQVIVDSSCIACAAASASVSWPDAALRNRKRRGFTSSRRVAVFSPHAVRRTRVSMMQFSTLGSYPCTLGLAFALP